VTFNELSRRVREYALAVFSQAAAAVAHRAVTTLAHRMQQVTRCGLSGNLTVKVVYRDGVLLDVFVQQDDKAPEVVAFNA